MRLSADAQEALRLLAGCERESVNAYGLSNLSGAGWARTATCLEILGELDLHGFVSLKDPDDYRAWGPECDHYTLVKPRIRDWAEEDAIELAEPAEGGPRERLSALAR